ncbi:hypothetical protein [Streptomyces sp. DH12]|uniref:hypothetical protein n=1 Tax=Streptomyces sp. DH12 TaxID=2857010 RepID=UPI001E2C7995|nr:hypothetical protein [Streptomyces sp. DH12]
MAATDLPAPLISYLEKRDNDRAEAAAALWAALTDRERALVKDAAVMGYVQGMQHPSGERIPKDSRITYIVVDACRAFPDLYPTLGVAAAPDARPAYSRWRVETRDPDADEWAPGMPFGSSDEAHARRALLDTHHPKCRDGRPVERRVVRETTTWTIEETR